MQMRIIGAVALAAALIGCDRLGEDRSMLTTVPADAPVVVDVDLDRLLKMSGCDSEHGVITLTPELAQVLDRRPGALMLIQGAASQGNWVDLARSVIFQPAGAPLVLTAEAKEDCEPTVAMAESKHKSRILDDAEFCALADGLSILKKGRQVWIAGVEADSLARIVESSLGASRQSSIASSPICHEFFSSSALLKAKIDVGIEENPWGEKFDAVLLAVNVSERLVTCRAQCAYKGSLVDPISEMQDVDPMAFQDLPFGTVMALAAGVRRDALKMLPQMVASLPQQSRLALSMVSELLGDEGGTVAFAAAPGGSAETIRNFSLDTWLMRIMLPTADKGEAAAEIVNHLAPDNVYAEADDDYLRIWNYDPFCDDDVLAHPSAGEARMQEGDKAAAFVSIPYKSEAMKAMRLARGYDISLALADSSATMTARMLGPSNYILPAVIQDLAKVGGR